MRELRSLRNRWCPQEHHVEQESLNVIRIEREVKTAAAADDMRDVVHAVDRLNEVTLVVMDLRFVV